MRLAAAFIILLSAMPAAADTEDYLIVFAADGKPYKPTRAHTFAAVVRIATVPGCAPRIVDSASLSWLPASMKVRAWKMWPETGRNVPLDETLRTYEANGSHICMWGPYRIQPELAEIFLARVARIESYGKYQAACLFARLHVCDCARSVEEMLGTRRRYIGIFGYGAAAASVIVKNFSPWMIHPEQSHCWVGGMIGLDQYQLHHRPFGDYTSRKDQFRASFRLP